MLDERCSFEYYELMELLDIRARSFIKSTKYSKKYFSSVNKILKKNTFCQSTKYFKKVFSAVSEFT